MLFLFVGSFEASKDTILCRDGIAATSIPITNASLNKKKQERKNKKSDGRISYLFA